MNKSRDRSLLLFIMIYSAEINFEFSIDKIMFTICMMSVTVMRIVNIILAIED